MFWRKRASIDSEELEWFAATWEWLDSINGPVDRAAPRQLILPNRHYFPDPDTELEGHARAVHYFDKVKDYCRMTEWHCEISPQAERLGLKASAALGEMSSSGALGTYSRAGNTAVITYDPELARADSPEQLIATFAHELSHYRLENAIAPIPGGSDCAELATDLCTVHLGFGLFGANNAFVYKQTSSFDSQGWSYQRSGYLSEPMWTFANAAFVELIGAPPEAYAEFAKYSIAAGMKKNRAYLKANPNIIGGLRSSTNT